MNKDKKDNLLPPRPGETPVKKEIKGVPFLIYINGQPIEMSKQEALGVMSQVINILCYLDQQGETNG